MQLHWVLDRDLVPSAAVKLLPLLEPLPLEPAVHLGEHHRVAQADGRVRTAELATDDRVVIKPIFWKRSDRDGVGVGIDSAHRVQDGVADQVGSMLMLWDVVAVPLYRVVDQHHADRNLGLELFPLFAGWFLRRPKKNAPVRVVYPS